ncbi:hypothetical protein L7F22_003649 [Adiantum nelumboides]|nr:hypothetical protein [Adiantum nelumboides]
MPRFTKEQPPVRRPKRKRRTRDDSHVEEDMEVQAHESSSMQASNNALNGEKDFESQKALCRLAWNPAWAGSKGAFEWVEFESMHMILAGYGYAWNVDMLVVCKIMYDLSIAAGYQFLSSGTTEAKEKYLPYHEGLNEGTLEIAWIAGAFRDRAYPISKGARILEFLFCGKFRTTRGGVKLGTASTHMIRSEVFKQRQSNNGFRSCSPHAVVLGSDCRQVMYCHLLCGLLYSFSVEVLSAPFAYTLVEALRTLESEWEFLCHDLHTGTLNCNKVTDATLRAAVGEILTPNPRLAAELFSKCRALACDGWRGVMETLWPQCKYVLSI